jgi:aspartyl-tRNA(Asn)/glutamyl-tRNA(Gln) amidotransferase subunit C
MTSKISKEEVKHIAKLARIDLTEKEIEKMQKDLSSILDYFELLKKAPKLEKSENIFGDLKSLRKDETISDNSIADKLLLQVPEKKDGYVKVKSIL